MSRINWCVSLSGALAGFYGPFIVEWALWKWDNGFWDKVDRGWRVGDGSHASRVRRFIRWCGGVGRDAPGRLGWVLVGIKKGSAGRFRPLDPSLTLLHTDKSQYHIPPV